MMVRAWKVAVVAVAATTLTSLSVSPASAAPVAASAGVTIMSPDVDATVAGDVAVRVHLVPPDTGVFTELDLQLGSTRVTTPLDDGTAPGCAIECDLTVTVPTGGWSPPSDVDPPTYDPDGSVTLVAVATNSFGTWSDSRVVTLDNDRPLLTVLDLPPVTGASDDVIGLAAQDTLTVRADSATTGGPEVASVELTVPWAVSSGRPPAAALTRAPDGRWTGTLDTATYPDGYFTGWLVALDANGVASVAARVPFVVDRGLRLSLAPPTVVHAGATELSVAAARDGKPTTWPVSFALRVDGRTVYTASGSELWQHPMSWTRALPPVDTANGTHQVGWEVLDNRGATSSVTRSVTLNSGPTVTVGQTYAVRGQTLDVTAGLTAFSGGSVRTWRLEAVSPSGRHTVLTEGACSVSCASARTVRVPTSFDQAGSWKLWVVATDSFGAVRDTTRTIAVAAPSSTRLVSSASALAYGSSVRMTGTVLRDGKALPGATVSLQFRPAGSSAWSTRATGRTGPSGVVSWTTSPTGSGTWRAVTAGRSGSWGGSTSGSVGVGVRARVRLVSAPSTSVHGRAGTWTWDADPYQSGVRVWVQVRRPGGSWVTVAKPLVSSTGAAVARVTFSSRGTWYVRAVRPGTSRVSTGVWSTTRWVS